MELHGDKPVPCELSTIFSSVLDDPHVSGPDAVDGAARWMGLNDESDLWGAMSDVVGMGEVKGTYLVVACVFLGCLPLLQLLQLLHECQIAPETLLFLHRLSEGQSVVDPLFI